MYLSADDSPVCQHSASAGRLSLFCTDPALVPPLFAVQRLDIFPILVYMARLLALAMAVRSGQTNSIQLWKPPFQRVVVGMQYL
jgi:hypothetical protein